MSALRLSILMFVIIAKVAPKNKCFKHAMSGEQVREEIAPRWGYGMHTSLEPTMNRVTRSACFPRFLAFGCPDQAASTSH